MIDINNKEGSHLRSMNQSTIISISQHHSRSKSRRFQRTVQRSQSSLSYRSSKSKDTLRPKAKDGTYIKKNVLNSPTPDNSDMVSQNSQVGVCNFSGILSAKSRDQFNVVQRRKQSKYGYQTPSRNTTNRHRAEDEQFYSQKKEIKLLQEILKKQRRMRESAQLENNQLLKQLAQIQRQYNNLQQTNKENEKQLRNLRIQINHLEAERQQNASLWKTIDIMEIDKIQKQQQIRELLLFRQTDEKTILRLTEEIANYRKRKNHKLPPFPMAEHEFYFHCPNMPLNLNQSQVDSSVTIQRHLEQKDRQIQKLSNQIMLLSSRMQDQCKRLAEDKKKITYQYERKLAAISSSYRIVQRQLNILKPNDGTSKNSTDRKKSEDFEYSLSPPHQN